MGEGSTFSWGWVIFIVLILWFFAGGGAFGGCGGGYRNGWNGGCSGTSGCEIEKQEIIDSAATRYLIETSSRNTTDSILANQRAQYNQEQQEKIFDLKMNNLALQNQISQQAQTANLDAKFCALNHRLDMFECQTPKVPTFYSAGAYSPFFPCGYYGWNGCNTCNSGNF